MSSTTVNQGLSDNRPSSRVLKAPGGGSSNIFGGDDPPRENVPRAPQKPQNNSNANNFGATADTGPVKPYRPRDNNIFGTAPEQPKNIPAEPVKQAVASVKESSNKAVKLCKNMLRGLGNLAKVPVLPDYNTNRCNNSASDTQVHGKDSDTPEVIIPASSRKNTNSKYRDPITQELRVDGRTDDGSARPEKKHYGDVFKNPITGEIRPGSCVSAPPSRQRLVKEKYKNVITGELETGVTLSTPPVRPQSAFKKGLYVNVITSEMQPGATEKKILPRRIYSNEVYKNPITGEYRPGHAEPERTPKPSKSREVFKETKFKNPITQDEKCNNRSASPPRREADSRLSGNYTNPFTGELKPGLKEEPFKKSLVMVPHDGNYKNPITGELYKGVVLPIRQPRLSTAPKNTPGEMADPIVGTFKDGRKEKPPRRGLAGTPYGKGKFVDPIVGTYRPDCEPTPRPQRQHRGLKCPITGTQYDGQKIPLTPPRRPKSAALGAPKGGFNPITGEAYEGAQTTQKTSTKVRQPPGGVSSVQF